MNVVVISTTFIPSVLLCGHCQLEFLAKQDKVNYRFVISHFTNKKDIEWADIIIYIRGDSDIDAYVSKYAKKCGKRLVYVLDDDLLNIPENLNSSPFYLMPSTKKNIRTVMSNCDVFLTPSPVLMEKYGSNFKYKYLISEPSLNRINKREPNDKVKIGFAGSIDRAQDINNLLEDAITQIVEKYKDSIAIEFIGAKPNFIEKLGLTYLPYQDGYDAYTAYMAKCNWDIGLAPMPKTEFHRCKYFNKYVEYASFGIAGIYSNCEPYTYGIRNKENGLLCENTTEAWVKAISQLIDNKRLRNKISKECLTEANEVYALDVLAEDYYKKIMVDYVKPVKKGFIPNLGFAKFIIFFKRVYRKIVEQGADFPTWLQDKLDTKKEEYLESRKDKKNKEELKSIISKRKTLFIFSPMFDDSSNKYNQRVAAIDKAFEDCYKVYFSGEDRRTEHITVDFIDDNHAKVICNSYDVVQSEEILNIIGSCKNCLIHGVIRFMRDKISNDMYKIFEMDNMNVIWDSHGAIPEEYHKASNFHTEEVLAGIEEEFYAKSNALICESESMKKHFISKYGKRDMKYIVYPTKEKNKKLDDIINDL